MSAWKDWAGKQWLKIVFLTTFAVMTIGSYLLFGLPIRPRIKGPGKKGTGDDDETTSSLPTKVRQFLVSCVDYSLSILLVVVGLANDR